MKIILANPRGFCAGVNMAIESLERALALFGSPIYVYHEIVHNRPIVERFRLRTVVPRQARGAAAVLTVSEHARDDLISSLDLDPARVFTVPNSIAPRPCRIPPAL